MGRSFFLLLILLLVSVKTYAGCDNPATEAETRVCIAADLKGADAEINTNYQKLKSTLAHAEFLKVRNEQRAWIKGRDRACQLRFKVKTMDEWYRAVLTDYIKTICVTRQTLKRNNQLKRYLASYERKLKGPAPIGVRRLQPEYSSNAQYSFTSQNKHSTGKYYYEMTLKTDRLSPAGFGILMVGISNGKQVIGNMLRISGQLRSHGQQVLGIAMDLDEGKVYPRVNGRWVQGQPGSNKGLSIKLGRQYIASAEGTIPVSGRMMPDMIAVNLGESAFRYSVPTGYAPFFP